MSMVGARGGSERRSLGARLREARERRNLSLQEVAERTKIPVTNLEALESDQGQRLPGGIFARSFVRTYAREVGVDPEEAVRDFVRLHPEHAAPDSEDDEVVPLQGTASGGSGRLVVTLVAIAVLFFVGFMGYRWLQGPTGTRSADTSTPTDLGASSSAVEEEQPAAGPPSSEPESPPVDAGGESLAAAASTAPELAAPAPGDAATAGVPPPSGPSETRAASDRGSGIRLEIHPTAPCWVRVSTDGRLRLERLVQPGERPVVVATEGVQLQVGDAGAFDYTINGRPGRSLGPAGRVVHVTITADNLGEFMAR